MESRKPEKGYDPNTIPVDYKEYEGKYKKYGIERKVVGHISENDWFPLLQVLEDASVSGRYITRFPYYGMGIYW